MPGLSTEDWVWDCCKSMNCPLRYVWVCACVLVCANVCMPASTVPLLSCCLFIIDAVLAAFILAIYPSTHMQARTTTQKAPKKQDGALAEKRQDKQQPTSKLEKPFLVCCSSSPSYLCLFYSLPSILLPVPLFSVSSTVFYLSVPPITHASCPLLPHFTPLPVCHFHRCLLFSLLCECSHLIFINSSSVCNLPETLSKLITCLWKHGTERGVINRTWR